MTRYAIVAFAVFGTLLAISAPPVIAADAGLEVGSQHSNDTDFNGAQTATNLTVYNTGESAYLGMRQNTTENIKDSEGDGGTESDRAIAGDSSTDQPISAEIQFHPSSSGTLDTISPNIRRTNGADYGFVVDIYIVNEGVDGTYGEGTKVYDNWDPSFSTGVQQIDISDYDVKANQNYTIEFVTDSTDNDGTRDNIEIGADRSATDFWFSNSGFGQTEQYADLDYTISDAADSAQYVSSNHSVSEVEEAAINLTLQNVSATVEAQYYDGSSWVVANTTTVSSTGNYTLDVSGHASATKWRTNVSFTKQDSFATGRLHDETYLFQAQEPSISNLSPPDNKKADTDMITFEGDINDPDFATAQSDSITAELLVDGSVEDTGTLNSNGTYSASVSGFTGGEHTWKIRATDDYGEVTTSSTRTISVPDTLYLRNETNHSQLVESSITTTVTFFGDENVYERTTSDGIVNLTGLPADQELIVKVEPSQNYTGRTVRLQSIYEQQSIYLLNKSEYATVESRFTLNDPTGQYDSETVLIIQKPINISGTVSYQTIAADQFGVEGVTATLQEGQRYRVKVRSIDNTVQIVGPYRADASETVTVRPGAPEIGLGNYTQGWAANATLDNRTLEYAYDDPENETDKVTVWIHEKGNTSNELQPNESYTTLGKFSATTTLTANESEKAWVVNFIIDRGGGEFTKSIEVSKKADLVPSFDREWRLIIAVGLLLVSAGAFSILNASVGGVVVAIEGGMLWWTGWLEGATIGAAVVLALFVAVLAHLYSSSV